MSLISMRRGDLPVQRNPMELVKITEATKRRRQPRSLTVEEFQKFAAQLEEPFRTLALVGVCFGLRISECPALKWSDVDWLNSKLRVERGIVRMRVGDVKTVYSGKLMAIDAEPQRRYGGRCLRSAGRRSPVQRNLPMREDDLSKLCIRDPAACEKKAAWATHPTSIHSSRHRSSSAP
jgi:integrase